MNQLPLPTAKMGDLTAENQYILAWVCVMLLGQKRRPQVAYFIYHHILQKLKT